MQPGTILHNYRFLEKLGEGGMGEVWLAEHVSIARKVAIKVLHAQYSRNLSLRARFRNEALTLSKLQHPNIVAFYDLIETDDLVCLVMEYVEGRNLEEMVRHETGPMPAPQLGAVFKQILLAFDHAHRAGVVHRDIKPSNFMLTADGTVKVLDFGIAKLLGEDHQLTRTGTRMGTTFYMSPEQVNGGVVDHRSDIYSLGVTLYVLATGRNPYDGETVEFKIYNRIVHEPLPAARAVYPAVPESVERMIFKATAKNPAQRFQNCGEFLVGAGIGNAVQPASGASPAANAAGAQVGKPSEALPLRAFKGLRFFAFVSTVGGVLFSWVPLLGSTVTFGSLPLFGLIASLLITFGSIGIIRAKAWSKWLTRISVGVYGIACAASVFAPGSRSMSYSSSTWTDYNGVRHFSESHSNNDWPFAVVATLATLYAIWGLYILFTARNQKYLDAMQ